MTAITVTLPWVVLRTDNKRYGSLNGRLLLTREYRQRKEVATMLAGVECKNHEAIDGPAEMHVRLYPPDCRRSDITNRLKIICDALTGSAYRDDSQLHKVTVERMPMDRKNPRAECVVKPLITV